MDGFRVQVILHQRDLGHGLLLLDLDVIYKLVNQHRRNIGCMDIYAILALLNRRMLDILEFALI